MEEKILIKSEQYNVKKGFKRIMLVGLILAIIAMALVLLSACIDANSEYVYSYNIYNEHLSDGLCGNTYGGYYYRGGRHCNDCQIIIDVNSSAASYIWSDITNVILPAIVVGLIAFAGITLIGGLICLCFIGFELTVTDKRIYGNVRKKRVDLPLDSVSAVSTGAFKSIAVASSSGRISFAMIKNRNEIHKIISDLLIDRQGKAKEAAPVRAENASNADELKKYKELLDSGVITQEEFDAKKKQLLGL